MPAGSSRAQEQAAVAAWPRVCWRGLGVVERISPTGPLTSSHYTLVASNFLRHVYECCVNV